MSTYLNIKTHRHTYTCVLPSPRLITRLEVRHCATMSDQGLQALTLCPLLRRIYASYCVGISDAGVRALADGMADRLQALELFHVPRVTADSIMHLMQKAPQLRFLNVGKCQGLGVEGLARVLARAVGMAQGLHVSTCHYLDY